MKKHLIKERKMMKLKDLAILETYMYLHFHFTRWTYPASTLMLACTGTPYCHHVQHMNAETFLYPRHTQGV